MNKTQYLGDLTAHLELLDAAADVVEAAADELDEQIARLLEMQEA